MDLETLRLILETFESTTSKGAWVAAAYIALNFVKAPLITGIVLYAFYRIALVLDRSLGLVDELADILEVRTGFNDDRRRVVRRARDLVVEHAEARAQLSSRLLDLQEERDRAKAEATTARTERNQERFRRTQTKEGGST